MQHFTETFLQFFDELSKNNNKEWMDRNRKRYHEDVRDAFNLFVQDMILRIRQHDPGVEIEPKDAVFRINNDIRFNPDKQLYKTHMAAVISKYGRKDMDYPGFYFQLSAEKIIIAGGSYMINKQHLEKVRYAIAGNPDPFYKIIENKKFKDAYGELRGEENKRLPSDLTGSAELHPVIFKKQFYCWAEEDASLITKDDLPEVLMKYYMAGKPLSDWLAGFYS